jgi:hypothetical protein
MIKAKRGLYPAYHANTSFETAMQVFGGACTRFKGGTPDTPRAGRHFLLMLESGRYAAIANYDDFPHTLELSVEVTEASPFDPTVAYMADLIALLVPLGLPIPTVLANNLEWIPVQPISGC